MCKFLRKWFSSTTQTVPILGRILNKFIILFLQIKMGKSLTVLMEFVVFQLDFLSVYIQGWIFVQRQGKVLGVNIHFLEWFVTDGQEMGSLQNLRALCLQKKSFPSFDPLSGDQHFPMAVRLWVFQNSALFWPSITLILSDLLMKEDLKTVWDHSPEDKLPSDFASMPLLTLHVTLNQSFLWAPVSSFEKESS